MSQSNLDLSQIRVRLLTDPYEKETWNEFVRKWHPLSSHRMMGEQLRYVAEHEGGWVACIGWSAATLKLTERDRWIGWTPAQIRQRLHLVAQNARFLILPGQSTPNLASRCLGLNCQVLSDDWQEYYGHPIFLAETFVESANHSGTCYRACGWRELGETRGYRRTRQGYRKHGVIKRILVKPLRSHARQLLGSRRDLAEDRPLPRLELSAQPVEGSSDGTQPSLFEIIQTHVTDPRRRKGRQFRLQTILGILLTGTLLGRTTCEDVAAWAKTLKQRERRRLRCPCRPGRGFIVPCANTMRYLLQDLNPSELESASRTWLCACGINTLNTHIAIDGKVLRGSVQDDQPAKAQLTAYDAHRDMVLDQIAVPEKTNEITAIRPLLEKQDLSGSIVTADAAHTNLTTATLINEKNGRFILILKANQPILFNAIHTAFASSGLPAEVVTRNRGHGRDELRSLTSLDTSPEDPAVSDFPNIRQVFQIFRQREEHRTGRTTHQTIYAISNAARDVLPPELAAQVIRNHWRIENCLHRQKDVRMLEDANRTRTAHAPHNYATIRNLALTACHRATAKAPPVKRWRVLARQPWRCFKAIGIGD